MTEEKQSKRIGCGRILLALLVGAPIALIVIYVATNGPERARENPKSVRCLANLRAIEAAKQAWAAQDSVTNSAATVTVDDLLPHLANKRMPSCVDIGQDYTLGTLGEEPRCRVHGCVSAPTPLEQLVKNRIAADRAYHEGKKADSR